MDGPHGSMWSLSRRFLAAVLAATCALTVSVSAPASAEPDAPAGFREPTGGPAIRGVAALPMRFQEPRDAAKADHQPTATALPAPAEAAVTLGRSRVRASSMPVWFEGGQGTARVRMADQATGARAGLAGPMVAVTPSGTGQGKARIGIDYQGFAEAYGGNYGSRLRLVQLPACAASTPEVAACRARKPLRSTNDTSAKTVSAEVAVDTAAVLAAVADPSPDGGESGTYAASDLKPSGSWTAGGNAGTFSYNYPITVPPAVSELAPKVGISYDSGAIDGQTSSTQAQSSWVGDGWSTPQSYIEQTFTSCRDKPEGKESPKATDDLCYAGPILTLSLNGSTTALVWDNDKDQWRPESDNGEVVVRGSADFDSGSSAKDKRYWQVTTRDGTIYQFGRNRLPGWNTDRPVTNSVDTVPVYSPHSSGPCYSSAGFAASVCTTVRRWNLDYVTDVHGNAMTYFYKQESNRYGQNLGATDVSYVRDSWLDRIEYGFTGGNVYASATNRVQFTVTNRCAATCAALSASTKSLYPDVPFDLVCAGTTDCSAFAPSFFSTKRLASITAQQWNTTAGALRPVDTYTLDQSFPATGDGTSPALWLKSIVRTGHAKAEKGTSLQLPPVTFASIKLPNRVDTLSGYASFYRHRVASVRTETGSVISASYVLPEPCSATKPTPASNAKSCFPVRWTPAGLTDPILDWFNKYAVSRVVASDPVGGADTVTSYAYLGGAAWHYDDNELIKAKHRTYGQFRGYAKVRMLLGDEALTRRTKSETAYYRGMSKNNNSTAVNVTDSVGGVHEDRDELAGAVLEETVYRGETATVDNTTINAYWVSANTATRTRTGLPALTANRIAPVLNYSRQAVTSGESTTWRATQVDSSYDDDPASATFGVLKASYHHTVPANAAYDECTVNTYAPVNAGRNLVGLVSQTETLAKACGGFVAGSPPTEPGTVNSLAAPASVSRPAHTISATRTFYDDPDWSTTFPQTTAPTRGLPTMTRQAEDHAEGAYSWQTSGRTTYDPIGRPTAAYDPNGNATRTVYAVNAVGLPTGATVTNAAGHTAQTVTDPMRGTVLTSVGANNETTTQEYDELGRVTSIWLNSRPTTQAAHRKFTYVVTNSGVSSTTTQTVNDASGYNASTVLYDAQLRPRQTQADTPMSGRMVNDTLYDSRGWVTATYNNWWDSEKTLDARAIATKPNLSSLVRNMTANTYDFLGRAVVVDQKDKLSTISQTITVYGGDRVTVIPPEGATVSATITDPIGRTSSLVQYTSRPTVSRPTDTFAGEFTLTGGTTTTSRYGYDARGNQDSVTDAAGNEWTSTFDLLGRLVRKSDPDAGTTTGYAYDANGNLLQSTDARGKTTSSTYDVLNRKIEAYAAPASGQTPANKTAAWVYDNADNAVVNMPFAKGKLTSSTAYWNGAAYKTQIKGFNVAGASTGETISIPDTEDAQLRGDYTFTHTFSTYNLLPLRDFFPNKAGLPAETALHNYNRFDSPHGVGTTHGGLNEKVVHDEHHRVIQSINGNSGKLASIDYTYDPHTGQIVNRDVRRNNATRIDNEEYKYDKAGNLVQQKSTRFADANKTETQCYAYDQLVRLTDAWTATDACAAKPTDTNRGMVGSTIGGNSAYWTSWAFNAIGNRTTQVQRNLTGGTDNTTTYAYDGNDTGQPHTLTETTGTAPNPSTSFAYDVAGNMTTRNAGNGPQTLTWNDSGQLTKVSGTTGDTTNIYDADGNLLLQKNPQNTTLYLPRQQHVLDHTTGTVTGARYHPMPGGGFAVRTGTGTNLNYAITDAHGTPTLYLDSTAQIPTWRQYTPYGEPRGAAGAYPDNRGFLNRPTNATTGLTRLGARDYDYVIGAFISVDPLQDLSNPQQWQGYSYGDNNPITKADPDGLIARDNVDPGGARPDVPLATPAPAAQIGRANGPSPLHVGLKSAGKRIAGTGKGLWNLGVADNRCRWLRDTEACGRVVSAAESQVASAYDVGVCTSPLGGLIGNQSAACHRVAEDVGCPVDAGFTAECAGNVGAELAMAAVAKGAGRASFKAGRCHSFAADTAVLMADGTAKPISDVEVGDEVIATDPKTGETTNREVTALFTNVDVELTNLKLTTQDGTAVIETTQHHPFWNVNRGEWVDAGTLQTDDLLTSLVPHNAVRVATVSNFASNALMYDLTVDVTHTYYVVAGTAPVLVHNCGTEDFAHGTSAESGRNIVDNGLNEAASSANLFGSKAPGSFFTVPVDQTDKMAALETAGGWGARHGGDTCVVVCRLPKDVVTDLESRGLLSRTATPLQAVFHPDAFPAINQHAEWIGPIPVG